MEGANQEKVMIKYPTTKDKTLDFLFIYFSTVIKSDLKLQAKIPSKN